MSRELLFRITKKDFEVTWFSGSGSGGQHRNKHKNCCRLKHLETGVIVTGQSNRQRLQNQKEALEGLMNNDKFKLWHSKKCSELMLDKDVLNKKYTEMCQDFNFKYEIKCNGKWIEVDSEIFEKEISE